MEIEPMGRVLTHATIENLEDIWAQKVGVLKHGRVRQLEIDNALVDSGATLLSIPTRLIRELGLERVSSKHGATASHSYCKALETFRRAARSAGTIEATTTTKSSKIGAPTRSHG